ncbi:hypothetical protein [Winogradskyella tangerina]|uniref:hypothetical protein n=1 Tax=Winogradskyella tangerina TaxID=2023240 RepID=UPI000DBE95BB|nr:hypothetical protein [Winogradskyella tangerina]
MKKIILLAVFIAITSCVKNESVPIVFQNNTFLPEDLENNLYQTDAIFTFAGNDLANSDHTNIYAVIEEGASDIKFYETDTPNINEQDLYRYLLMEIQPTLISDAKIKTFRHTFLRDEWIIMTYKIEDKIKLSSPIRINNLFRQTDYIEDIVIDQGMSGSANFEWSVQSAENNAFFFEIMKDQNDAVLSLTFTNDSHFQYFDLTNVTLNLSQNVPPNLVQDENYEFTVLDIGLDNWINTVHSRAFIAE